MLSETAHSCLLHRPCSIGSRLFFDLLILSHFQSYAHIWAEENRPWIFIFSHIFMLSVYFYLGSFSSHHSFSLQNSCFGKKYKLKAKKGLWRKDIWCIKIPILSPIPVDVSVQWRFHNWHLNWISQIGIQCLHSDSSQLYILQWPHTSLPFHHRTSLCKYASWLSQEAPVVPSSFFPDQTHTVH